jgi:hypothetical protein
MTSYRNSFTFTFFTTFFVIEPCSPFKVDTRSGKTCSVHLQGQRMSRATMQLTKVAKRAPLKHQLVSRRLHGAMYLKIALSKMSAAKPQITHSLVRGEECRGICWTEGRKKMSLHKCRQCRIFTLWGTELLKSALQILNFSRFFAKYFVAKKLVQNKIVCVCVRTAIVKLLACEPDISNRSASIRQTADRQTTESTIEVSSNKLPRIPPFRIAAVLACHICDFFQKCL